MQYANDTSTPFTSNNVAVGFEALRGSATASANTGNSNTAVGYQTLLANTTGFSNTANGYQALYSNTLGFNNTASGSGAGALFANTTGNTNTAFGSASLSSNTTGNQNTAVGGSALAANITGSTNTGIGNGADVSAGNLTNATVIGYAATVNSSNKVRLGNAAVTVIEGQVAYTAASDRRLKTNIQNLNEGLDFILKLNPVSYKMKNQEQPKINWGFIAQEIEELLGTDNAILTIGGDKDRTLGLRYTDFIAPLVKAVQEQQQKIQSLEERLVALENKLLAEAKK